MDPSYTPTPRERAQAAGVVRQALDLVADVVLGSAVLAIAACLLWPVALALYATDHLRQPEPLEP